MPKLEPEEMKPCCAGCTRPIEANRDESYCFICHDQLGLVLRKACEDAGRFDVMLTCGLTYRCVCAERDGDWLVLQLELPEVEQTVQVRLSEVVMAREVG